MVVFTTLIALLFVFLILRSKPGTALGLLVLSMLIWPEYLRIPFGIMQMSIPRILALVCILYFGTRGAAEKFSFNFIDFLVLFGWLWPVLSSFIVDSGGQARIGTMLGRGLDTFFLYLSARICLQRFEDLEDFKKVLIWVAVIMGCLGCIEALTSYSPYQGLIKYRTWSWIDKPDEYRLGLLRAKASTAVSIFFGMAMMMVFGCLLALRSVGQKKWYNSFPTLMAVLGALSTMSSGPWIACFIAYVVNLLRLKASLIRPLLIVLVLGLLFIEVASNRHFYNLIDYLALSGKNAWYRTRLIEVAFAHWDEYYLFGVGGASVDHWAQEIDGRGHVDVVNYYIVLMLYGGVATALAYIFSHILAIARGVAFWRCADIDRKNVMFGLLSTLIALDISTMSVGLFGPALLMGSLLLGIIVNMSGFDPKGNESLPVNEETSSQDIYSIIPKDTGYK